MAVTSAYAQISTSGIAVGGPPNPQDDYLGLSNAPCSTSARLGAGTATVKPATAWEAYWHLDKIAGRWMICDPEDNAWFAAGFQTPGIYTPSTSVLAKYGPISTLANYIVAQTKRWRTLGITFTGENGNSNSWTSDAWLPIPNATANPPISNMVSFPWVEYANVDTRPHRRVNYQSGGQDNTNHRVVKLISQAIPSILRGEPWVFPGVSTGQMDQFMALDYFDPQMVCSIAVYETDDNAAVPAQCPSTNNYGRDMTVTSFLGGSLNGVASTTGATTPGVNTYALPANTEGVSVGNMLDVDAGQADGDAAKVTAVTGCTGSGACSVTLTTKQSHPADPGLQTDSYMAFTSVGDSDYDGYITNPAPGVHTSYGGLVAHLGFLISAMSPTMDGVGPFAGEGASELVQAKLTQNVTHSTSAQVVTLDNVNNFGTVAGIGSYGYGVVVDRGTSHEEFIPSLSISCVGTTPYDGGSSGICGSDGANTIRAIFTLDHAAGASDAQFAWWGGAPDIYTGNLYGNSGQALCVGGSSECGSGSYETNAVSGATILTAAVAASAQCLSVSFTQNISASAPNNAVTLDPGMSGYDGGVTYEDGPYTVDGVGASGPSGCNGANNVHITTGLAHAHALHAIVQSPLAQDTTNYTKAEWQAWEEGSGITQAPTGPASTGGGGTDDIVTGSGYGTGDTGVCKLDEAWGLIPASYNCATLAGWPLTFASTITQNVTGSTTAQAVTVSSTASLIVGEVLDVDAATANRELVAITAIGTGTVTGVFIKSHSTNAVIEAGGYCHWGSNGAWNGNSASDPGCYFLDENGFHTWVSEVAPDEATLSEIGNSALTAGVTSGASVTVSVADLRGFRNGTTAYLDAGTANTESGVVSNATWGTFPAGAFTMTLTKSHASGAVIQSQQYNDLDSMLQHYVDYFSRITAYYGHQVHALVLGPDHVDAPQPAALRGFGGKGYGFDLLETMMTPGSMCETGWWLDYMYKNSGVPIMSYYRSVAQEDSPYRDLTTTLTAAITANVSAQVVNLACQPGTTNCNIPASGTYNAVIDAGTPNEEFVAATFTRQTWPTPSTISAVFTKNHNANAAVWVAVANPVDQYGVGDWDAGTQADRGQAFWNLWLTGNTAAYCPTNCATQGPDPEPPYCPNLGLTAGHASNYYYLGNLAGTAQGAWNLQDTDGTYFMVGYDRWQQYDASDRQNYGMQTLTGPGPADNPYDGKCDTTAAVSGWDGYPCGGEPNNYGDSWTGTTQTDHQIWTNMANWVAAH